MRVAAFDYGGSYLRGAVFTSSLGIEERTQITAPRDRTAGVTWLASFAERVGARAIGVAVAAQVDRAGRILLAPNLGWSDVDLGGELAAATRLRVRIVNDVNAIGVSEATIGAGKGARDVLMVALGTGLGAAAVSGGVLVEGASGVALELGHIRWPGGDRHCGCGARGCIEAYVGGAHLGARYIEYGGDTSGGSAKELEARCAQGDSAAKKLWADVAEKLAFATSTAVTLLNPEVLVLGGGVLRHAPALAGAVRERVMQTISACAARGLSVREPALGDDAGLVGAGLLARGLQG